MTEQSRGSGSDPLGEFQRWLLRSGARGVGRELGEQVRTAFGGSRGHADVWDTVTSEAAGGEAPECAWCPVCRAARLLRESGPGLMSHVSAAGDALGTLLQDAMSVAESALASAGRAATAPSAGGKVGESAAAGGGAPVVDGEVVWGAVQSEAGPDADGGRAAAKADAPKKAAAEVKAPGPEKAAAAKTGAAKGAAGKGAAGRGPAGKGPAGKGAAGRGAAAKAGAGKGAAAKGAAGRGAAVKAGAGKGAAAKAGAGKGAAGKGAAGKGATARGAANRATRARRTTPGAGAAPDAAGAS